MAEGHYSTLLCHLANISFLVGNQKLIFDPRKETFEKPPEANHHLKRTDRKPWVVPEQV